MRSGSVLTLKEGHIIEELIINANILQLKCLLFGHILEKESKKHIIEQNLGFKKNLHSFARYMIGTEHEIGIYASNIDVFFFSKRVL